jgi:flavin reductase (DIM6/NTAB) family NADH-FMN oxidoreductase RutF
MVELPLAEKAFREVAARYATGVVVVTTRADGFDHAMTANSFTAVSLDPMLVLICVEKDTRFHDALCADVDELGESEPGQAWAVSMLAAHSAPTASWFATKGRPLHGQFDRVRHQRGSVTDMIVLDEAIATMEVRTRQRVSAGDHTVVIGEVVSLSVREELIDKTPADESGWPLAYWARRYRSFNR